MTERRILLIDDDATLRLVLERLLSRAGYDVWHASDGREGIQTALDRRPDLIVLDVMMPGIDGFEVCRRLKATSATAAIPVILLSGSLNPSLRQRAFALGAVEALLKPDDIDLLAPMVQAVFRRADESRPSTGRVVTVFGKAAARRAIDLAEAVALHSNWPVLLIDFDLQDGPIGAHLAIRPNPDCVDLLERAPVPLTAHDIGDCVQPYRLGLGIVPAPLGRGAALQPERIPAALAELRVSGYYVVAHAGAALNRTAAGAMRGADLTCAVMPDASDAGASFRVLLAELEALGVDTDGVVPVGVPGEAVRHYPPISREAIAANQPAAKSRDTDFADKNG